MKRPGIVGVDARFAIAGVLGSALAVFVVACADAGPGSSSPAKDDAGTVVPAMDASAPDADPAPSDAGTDAEDADAGPRICSDDHFCHTVVPAGQRLRGVWGDSGGIVWAVSLERKILRWDGTSWKVYSELDAEPVSIWGSGPTDVWIVTKSGLLRGGGESSAALVFSPVADLPGDPTIPIHALWGNGPGDVWAVGGENTNDGWPLAQKGRVLHYGGDAADGGTGWTVDDVLSSQDIGFRGVFGNAATGVWVHGIDKSGTNGLYRARVLRRPPGAAEWISIELPDDTDGGPRPYAQELFAASATSSTSIWLRGKTGVDVEALWHGTSSDGGATFTWTFTRVSPFDRAIAAFWGTSSTDTWAVGMNGLVSRYNGGSWQQAVVRVTSHPVGKSFWAIWGTASDDFWVVGDDIALHRTNAGEP